MPVYRLYPTLWNDGTNMMAQTVYAIDRTPPLLTTICSRRPCEDPSFYWLGPVFQRIVPQDAYCNAVTWATLPSWLSYASSLGYTYTLDAVKPYSDIYITGP